MKTRKMQPGQMTQGISKMGQMPKTAMKLKNAHENEKKIQLSHMPLWISKMKQMPKTVESTKLNKKCRN